MAKLRYLSHDRYCQAYLIDTGDGRNYSLIREFWENLKMFCSNCHERIMGTPVRQWDEVFCSQECAESAAGMGYEESAEYYEEDDLSKEFFSDDDE